MHHKNPPFEITNEILSQVTEIAELIGKLTATTGLSANPTLRRTNRIRTIYSSLAIEQNTLSLEQVTDVINGKRILAPPLDIAEVKNAYEIYEMMDTLNPYSVDDFLKAHGVMTRGLVEESGEFRSGSVGVVDEKGNVLHFGTLARYVPNAVIDLLEWVKTSQIHMLIKSCVFHYELELIHPFADGNGRMGRLWHTLLLTHWKPLFAWLPVESMIHNRQKEYYNAINQSNNNGNSTPFILFMLSAIREALTEALEAENPKEKPSAAELRSQKILQFLKENQIITNAHVRELFQVSSATANRILAKLTIDGTLQKVHVGRCWGYIQKKSL